MKVTSASFLIADARRTLARYRCPLGELCGDELPAIWHDAGELCRSLVEQRELAHELFQRLDACSALFNISWNFGRSIDDVPSMLSVCTEKVPLSARTSPMVISGVRLSEHRILAPLLLAPQAPPLHRTPSRCNACPSLPLPTDEQ